MNALKYAVKAALATYKPDGFTTPIFVHTPKRYAIAEALAYCEKYDKLAAFDLKYFVEIRAKNEHEKAHM